MCTSIGDIFNSVNKCENGAPYINALDLKFDVIALSETRLIDNDSDNYNIDGYKCISRFLATFLLFFSNILNVAYVDNFNLIA